MRSVYVLLAAAAALLACGAPTPGEGEGEAAGAAAPPASADGDAATPSRNAYFGDLHVHTRYSFDAFLFGTTADADYEFAKGGARSSTRPASR